jgi:hypothetical protein
VGALIAFDARANWLVPRLEESVRERDDEVNATGKVSMRVATSIGSFE